MKQKPRPVQHEYLEQVAFMQWCETVLFDHRDTDGRTIRLCLADVVEASLNGAHLQGTKQQRAAQWARLRRAGAKKNAPDLAINYPVGKFHGMRIEMKKAKAQFPSPSAIAAAIRPGQGEYLHMLHRLGYFSVVAYGWVEAAVRTCEYFGWPPRGKGLC